MTNVKVKKSKTVVFGSIQAQNMYRQASLRLPFAVILAAFPFLLIVDQRGIFDSSPVLPGLIVLAVIGIFSPVILVELWRLQVAKRDPANIAEGGVRRKRLANLALGLATLWLVGWFALGVA